jgi:putative flavoprotein involved in K+ transport
MDERERIETVVIGGGQTGLAVGHELATRGRSFVILDAHERIGDAWRMRWDSLLLFTPARIDGLPGMRVPAKGDAFITKDQMADYLEAYAVHFGLPVRTGTRVDHLRREGDRFVVSAGGGTIEADNVVVAMSNLQQPWTPSFAPDLDPGIVQMHSKAYRNPSQLQDGPVLVVGMGNSGADIGLEVARTHPTIVAGKEFGHVPVRIETWVANHVVLRIVRFVGHHVLTVRSPIGRKARPSFLTGAAPLVRVKPKDLVNAGIERVPRVIGVEGGMPVVDGGRVLEVTNVLWCTGFRPGFSWIELPIHGEHEPDHRRGIVSSEPGLYFVGLEFLYAATSETVTGVSRDARRVVRHLAARHAASNGSVSAAAGIAG